MDFITEFVPAFKGPGFLGTRDFLAAPLVHSFGLNQHDDGGNCVVLAQVERLVVAATAEMLFVALASRNFCPTVLAVPFLFQARVFLIASVC